MKRIFAAAIAAMTVLAFFAGCDTEPQDVKVVGTAKAAAPSNVTAEQTLDKEKILVKWVAAKDASGYDIYVQEEGKKTQSTITYDGSNVYATNSYVFSSANGNYVSGGNPDVDNWSCIFDVRRISNKVDSTGNQIPAGKYRFGVTAYNTTPGQTNSDIKWSDYISVSNPN